MSYRFLLGIGSIVLSALAGVVWIDEVQPAALEPGALSRPLQVTSGDTAEAGAIPSPNGKFLAFERFGENEGGSPKVWVMPISGGLDDARLVVDGTSFGQSWYVGEISWSPDSQWIAFIGHPVTGGAVTEQVFKVNIETRQAVQLTRFEGPTSLGAGTSWSKSGQVLFVKDGDLFHVSESGGPAIRVLDVQSSALELTPYFPVWSPNEEHIAFIGRQKARGKKALYVANAKEGNFKKLIEAVWDDGPYWLNTTHILITVPDNAGPKTRIALTSVRSPKVVYLTKDYQDVTPSVDVTTRSLFFSRRRVRPGAQTSITEGFHIWRIEFRDLSSLLSKVN